MPKREAVEGYKRGQQLWSAGRLPEAVMAFRQALAADAHYPECRLALAKLYVDMAMLKKPPAPPGLREVELETNGAIYFGQARDILAGLLKDRPKFAVAHALMGTVLLEFGLFEQALSAFQSAVTLNKLDESAAYNLGWALFHLNRFEEASHVFERLTRLFPRSDKVWHMLGESLQEMGKDGDAIPCYQRAVRLNPDQVIYRGAMARAFNNLGRNNDAIALLDETIARGLGTTDIYFMRAQRALEQADWSTGWRYYSCRYSAGGRQPPPVGFHLRLEPGSTIRIRHDQGLGDELFFLRFVPRIVAQGVFVQYATQSKLYPLLQGSPLFSVLDAATLNEPGLYDALVGDLPFLTGMAVDGDIPPPWKLEVDPIRREALKLVLLKAGVGPYVGVTWQGGSQGKDKSLYKAIKADDLGRLLKDLPVIPVLLQRLPKPEDVAAFSAALGRPFVDWCALNESLPEVLAGLSLLDEYVGVSNTNMHLLAGIGKSARVIVPHPPEWRWMAEGSESPWFPGFKIYRQQADLSWEFALRALAEDFKESIGNSLN